MQERRKEYYIGRIHGGAGISAASNDEGERGGRDDKNLEKGVAGPLDDGPEQSQGDYKGEHALCQSPGVDVHLQRRSP